SIRWSRSAAPPARGRAGRARRRARPRGRRRRGRAGPAPGRAPRRRPRARRSVVPLPCSTTSSWRRHTTYTYTVSLRLFATVFGAIFVAELPDKTALAAMMLATRYRPLPVFFGAGLALTVQSALAVAAGSLLARLPPRWIHIGAGLLFLGCA